MLRDISPPRDEVMPMLELDQRLIEDLQQMIADPTRALRPLDRPLAGYTPPPPATSEQVRESERQLGFRLPTAVRQLYTLVANGGFGPDYGLLGLIGGAPDEHGHTAVESYLRRREEATDWWPQYLLPFCNWGCAMYSCVDCGPHFRQGRMVRFDPNISSDPPCLWDERRDLATWLRVWIDQGSRAVFQDGLSRSAAALWRDPGEPDPASTLMPPHHPGQGSLFEGAALNPDEQEDGGHPAR
jgi:hypothetical protein